MAAVAAGPVTSQALNHLMNTLTGTAGPPDVVARDEAYWQEVQRAFPVDRSLIHLNNGGVSTTPALVQQALHDHQAYAYKVPFYAHRSALQPQLEAVRRRLAQTFGCTADELALTRNIERKSQLRAVDARSGA